MNCVKQNEGIEKEDRKKIKKKWVYITNGFNELSDSFFIVEYSKNGRFCWNAQTLKMKKVYTSKMSVVIS